MHQSVWWKEHWGVCDAEHSISWHLVGMTCLSQRGLTSPKNIHFCSWVMSQPKKIFEHRTRLCTLPLCRHSPLGESGDLSWVPNTSGWKYIISWTILSQIHTKNLLSHGKKLFFIHHISFKFYWLYTHLQNPATVAFPVWVGRSWTILDSSVLPLLHTKLALIADRGQYG